MKLKDKIRNEHGVVTIDNLRGILQDSITKLTKFSYNVSKDFQKKINLVVEYYIMNYYRTQDIEGIDYEDLLKEIELVLSIVTDVPIYTDVVDKEYDDVLWWVVYQQFGIEELHFTDYSSPIVLRVLEAINCVESGDYPESYLDSFHPIQLEECINNLYSEMMSEFLYGDDFNF